MANFDTTATRTQSNKLVTRHQGFNVGAVGLFAVQPGIDVNDAFNALGILLETARGSADHLASTFDKSAGDIPPSAPWAPVYFIEMALALTESIHAAYFKTQRDDASKAEGSPAPAKAGSEAGSAG